MKSTTESHNLPLQFELHLFNWLSSNHLALLLSLSLSVVSRNRSKYRKGFEFVDTEWKWGGGEKKWERNVSHKLTLTKLHTHFAH